MTKPKKPVVSVEAKDLLALLDSEEINQLEAVLSPGGTDALGDSVGPFSGVSMTLLLREILSLRMPFVRMLSELLELLQYIEGSVQGNVEFIVIPDDDHEFSLDLSPQMREKVAKAIDANRLIQGAARIEDCLSELQHCIEGLLDAVRPTYVRKPHPLLEARRKVQSQLQPHLAELHRLQNEFLSHQMEHGVYVYRTEDAQAMRALVDKLQEASTVCDRLIVGSKQTPSIVRIRDTLRRLIGDGTGKANKMFRALNRDRHTERDREIVQHFSRCHESLKAFQEALFAVSQFEEGTKDLRDFLTLDIWKQRWRIYEVWVLAHIVNLLRRQGAQVYDTSRVQDGWWTLKYGRDTKPVLGLSVGDKTLEVYYQYFKDSPKGGSMPDIAVKIPNRDFVLVIDPKHGYRGQDEELRTVAIKYAKDHKPHLSCVVNYFDKISPPAFEELCAPTRAVVMWGVAPGGQSIDKFDHEVLDTLAKAGCAWTAQTTVVVLFDVSRSAREARDRLVVALRDDLRLLPTSLTDESRLLLFGSSIVRDLVLREARLEMLTDIPDEDGTDFDLAINESVARVRDKPHPRQVWLFTDGEGTLNIEAVSATLRQHAIQLRVVETGGSVPSVLVQLCERVRGEHQYLHRGPP
jgi:hypothetical protein